MFGAGDRLHGNKKFHRVFIGNIYIGDYGCGGRYSFIIAAIITASIRCGARNCDVLWVLDLVGIERLQILDLIRTLL